MTTTTLLSEKIFSANIIKKKRAYTRLRVTKAPDNNNSDDDDDDIVRYSKKCLFLVWHLKSVLCRDLSFDKTNGQQADGKKKDNLWKILEAWTATISSYILIICIF